MFTPVFILIFSIGSAFAKLNLELPEDSSLVPSVVFKKPPKQRGRVEAHFHSIMQYDSRDGLNVLNTGVSARFISPNDRWEVKTVVSVDIGEGELRQKKLSELIHQLSLKYRKSTAVVLHLGKLKIGTDRGTDFQNLDGVIGFKLSIRPSKLLFIEKWLDRHSIKVRGLGLARYAESSEGSLSFKEFKSMDTSYASLFATKGHQSSFFYTFKRKDGYEGRVSHTLGGFYTMEMKSGSLQFFEMLVSSESRTSRTNLHVGSLTYDDSDYSWDIGLRVTNFNLESVHGDIKTDAIELFTSTLLKDNSKEQTNLQMGIRYEEKKVFGSLDNETSYYIRLLSSFDL